MTQWWMIRAGDDNELIPVWKEKKIASIGWPQLANPKKFQTKIQMNAKADTVFFDEKPKSRNSWINQVWRFRKEIRKGDRLLHIQRKKENI